jgi:hypothetical protein
VADRSSSFSRSAGRSSAGVGMRVDQFESENLVVILFRKINGRVHIPGMPASQTAAEMVELRIRCADGAWRSVEIPLEEFYSLMFKQVFPALAKRVARAKPKA